MKNKLILGLGLFLGSLYSFGQQTTIDQTNTRDGETVEYCISHKKKAEYIQNHPEAVAQFQQDQIELQNSNIAKAPIIYIPVVFHVLHQGGTENISQEQIENAMDILNRDYAMANTDAANVHADFQGMPANSDIQFRFATKAPNGQCFNGITRTVTAATNNGDNGSTQVTAVQNGNDVYQGNWPGSNYLNVFVVADAGGAAGYTTTPNNFWTSNTMGNGIWILHDYVGNIGTGTEGRSRALTHEVGHWLNLEHTWGPNNNPGNAASCGDDDGVNDTPNTIGVTSCALNENSCGPRANVENYMDYSYCSKMYTAGQVSRMRSALSSTVGGRSTVVSVGNLDNVGANGNPTLCKAEFSSDFENVCVGSQIQFTDLSYNAASGWTWTFTGGTPSSSTQQNPTVTYNTPGTYAVTLTATDGSTNDTETKSGFIVVTNTTAGIPFLETFESLSTLTNSSKWGVYNPGNDNAFELETNAGHTGTKSARLKNYNQPEGGIDDLIGAPLDLSGQSQVTMSFRYAYKRRNSSDADYLKVLVSANCETYVLRKTINLKIGATVQSSQYNTPASADWKTIHVTNLTATYLVDGFRYKFNFKSGGGNNIFIDNINIYPGASNDNLVSSVEENENLSGLNIYPNPTDDELTVSFNLKAAQTSAVSIVDLTGKELQNHLIQANEGENLVFLNTQSLAAGVYMVKIKTGNGVQTLQFIVK